VRARRSQVDETLFGEPLSRQLLNRSKSMEVSGGGRLLAWPLDNIYMYIWTQILASLFQKHSSLTITRPELGAQTISAGGDPEPVLPPPVRPQQRPRTALATMRVAGPPRSVLRLLSCGDRWAARWVKGKVAV
jgi:hypothetical protein